MSTAGRHDVHDAKYTNVSSAGAHGRIMPRVLQMSECCNHKQPHTHKHTNTRARAHNPTHTYTHTRARAQPQAHAHTRTKSNHKRRAYVGPQVPSFPWGPRDSRSCGSRPVILRWVGETVRANLPQLKHSFPALCLSRVEVPLKVKGNAVRNLEVPMPEQIERFGKIIALFTDPSFQQDVLLLNAVNRTAGPKRQFWICALEQF